MNPLRCFFSYPHQGRAWGALGTLVMIVLAGCGKDGPSSAEEDLSGTWDVLGSSPGGVPLALTITLDAQHIDVIGAKESFVAVRSGTGFILTYSVGDRSAQVLALRENGGVMNVGALPFDLSGLWSFRTPDFTEGIGCNATFVTPGFSGECATVALPRWVASYQLGNGSARGNHQASAPSMFGDLGGTWNMQTTRGTACTFEFRDNTFSSRCSNELTSAPLGGVNVTFSGATVSGTTTSGVEFSAHRR
jgi:hypothetical protein